MNDPFLEENNWWTESRKGLVIGLVGEYSPGKGGLCEVGCGAGTMLSALKKSTDHECKGIELDSSLVEKARSRKLDVQQGDCCSFRLEEKADVVLLLDVLEHIEDHEEGFSNCVGQLREGGVVIVTVPAFNSLWSSHDEKLGHCRRYSKDEVMRLFEKNGLEVRFLSYWNFFLFPAIYLFRKLVNAKPDEVFSVQNSAAGIFSPLLGSILSAENLLIQRGIRLPVGVSIVAVGVKTNHTNRR